MPRNKALQKATTERDRVIHQKVRMMMFLTWQHISKDKVLNKISFECHSIARAISIVVPEVKLINGIYYGIQWIHYRGKKRGFQRECQHTWLVCPDGAILDPYPVGFISIDVVLVPTKGKYKVFGGNLYSKGGKYDSSVCWKEVRKKSRILAEVLRKVEKDPKVVNIK